MKFLKWFLLIILSLGIIGFITYAILDKPLPKGAAGPQAEELADQMLGAVNDSAWNAIGLISWNFVDKHRFLWDKNRHWVKVSWDNYEVYVNLNLKTGTAYAKGKKIERQELTNELVQEAYALWANDSFWLNPITKIKDTGTERSFIANDDPYLDELLVTYTSGGVTPGDSYLWLVNRKTGLPQSVSMWVSIVPLGGISFSWENWITTSEGAKISTFHEGLLNIKITEIETWSSTADYPNPQVFKDLESL